MNRRIFIKIIIDSLMLIALLALMAYELIGAAAHEWVGTGMFALIIGHNILSRTWWGDLIQSFRSRLTVKPRNMTIIPNASRVWYNSRKAAIIRLDFNRFALA